MPTDVRLPSRQIAINCYSKHGHSLHIVDGQYDHTCGGSKSSLFTNTQAFLISSVTRLFKLLHTNNEVPIQPVLLHNNCYLPFE
jgi:hypothetical protein